MSNPGISLTAPPDYESQLAAAQRQQQLAQALSKMGDEPIQAQSAGGISAPISSLSILAKALNSFGGSYMSSQANASQLAAQQAQRQQAQDWLKTTMGTQPAPPSPTAGDGPYTLPPAPAPQQAPIATPPPQQSPPPISDVLAGGPGGPAPSPMPQAQMPSPAVSPSPPPAPPPPQPIAPATPNPNPPSYADIWHNAMAGMAMNNPIIDKMVPSLLSANKPVTGFAQPGEIPYQQNPLSGQVTMGQPVQGNQLIPITPAEYQANGIDPRNVPPGSKLYKNPITGEITEAKLGDVKSSGAQDQAIATSKAEKQDARTIIVNNPTGGAPANAQDPKIADYAQNIHSGLVTLRSIPMQYRTAVSSYLAHETDQTGSPTTAALWAGAANRITSPYTQNPQYQLFAAAQPYLQRMNAAAGMKSSIGDTDLLDSLVKLETGGNAITDAQVLTSINGRSVSDSVNVLKNKLVAQGGVLSDQQRQEATKLGNTIYDNYKKGYQPLYKQASEQLSRANIPQAYWTIPDLNQLGPGLGSGGGQPTSKTINGVTYTSSDGGKSWYH